MKEYTVRIGKTDFSPFVDAKSYETALEPVVAWEMTDLTGTTHRVISRRIYAVKFRLHELPAEKAQELAAELQADPLPVTFTSLQTGGEIAAEMRIDELSYGHLLSAGGKNWLTGAALQLRQL